MRSGLKTSLSGMRAGDRKVSPGEFRRLKAAKAAVDPQGNAFSEHRERKLAFTIRPGGRFLAARHSRENGGCSLLRCVTGTKRPTGRTLSGTRSGFVISNRYTKHSDHVLALQANALLFGTTGLGCRFTPIVPHPGLAGVSSASSCRERSSCR